MSIFANSEDSDEMQHIPNAAFHLCLHYRKGKKIFRQNNTIYMGEKKNLTPLDMYNELS